MGSYRPRPRPGTRGRAVSTAGGGTARAFLVSLPGLPGPTAAVTHGGITMRLLRDLAGDDALRPAVLQAGIPPCAVTAIDNLNPVMIASVSHLT